MNVERSLILFLPFAKPENHQFANCGWLPSKEPLSLLTLNTSLPYKMDKERK